MTKNKKILLGILSFWPAVWMLLFFAFFLLMLFSVFNENFFGFLLFPLIFLFHFLTIIVIIGLLIFYIIHISNNKSLDQQMKAIWIVVMFLVNVVGFPVYWYMYIWKENAVQSDKINKNESSN